MAKKVEVVRPGVVDRFRVARTPKHCSLCGRQINPGESYLEGAGIFHREGAQLSDLKVVVDKVKELKNDILKLYAQ